MRDKSTRTVMIYVGLILLAGALHSISWHPAYGATPSYYFTTLIYVCYNAIYMGLLFHWVRSVLARLLPSRARSYMVAAAGLMVLFILVSTFKYRIAASEVAMRCAWYLYYLPLLFIPTLFAMATLRMRHGGRQAGADERLLLVPAAALVALVLTNDLHHLVFIPNDPTAAFVGETGTYGYGAPSYIAYAWAAVMLLVGIVVLLRLSSSWERGAAPLLAIVLIWVALNALGQLADHLGVPVRPYNMPEINTFCMLAVFESCVVMRLIPRNDNYVGLFGQLRLPVLACDRDLNPVYRSAGRVTADEAQLRLALEGPIYVEPGLRLEGRRVSGGYAFWVTDERAVSEANERLAEANELLEGENALMEYEGRQREEDAFLRSRHRIYHEVAGEMYPYQRRIAALLEDMRPDDADFPARLAFVSVLNAYVKRRTNLLLLASEDDVLNSRELLLAVGESARYLGFVGLRTSLEDVRAPFGMETMSAAALVALYDAFEVVVERLVGNATLLMVSMSEGEMRLVADAKSPVDVTDVGFPVRHERIDGLHYLSVPVPADASPSGGEVG